MKPILLLLLLPSFAAAQVIQPVERIESKDYLGLIKKDSAVKRSLEIDSTNTVRHADLVLQDQFTIRQPIKRISIRKKNIKVYNHYSRSLTIGGVYNATTEIKTINRLPALQSTYVQGSAENGELRWRGPETDEQLSYGPSIHTLEYDGSMYPYDINGRLVARGSGNGNKAKAYDNSIFRTAAFFAQSVNIQGRFLSSGIPKWNFMVKLGQTGEQTFIRSNKNNSKSLAASTGVTINTISITGSYNYLQHNFTNSNRNGFLNRVYQQSILTPISFENAQGSMIGSAQRRYNSLADNPIFLLDNNGNSFFHSQHNTLLIEEKKIDRFKFKLLQSLENVKQYSNEAYQAGTAYFPNGIATYREKTDATYFLKFIPSYSIYHDNPSHSSIVSASYSFDNASSAIRYSGQSPYQYQRSSHDLILSYLRTYSVDDLSMGADIGNKFYFSNTIIKDAAFLPTASVWVTLNNVFEDFNIRLVSNFNRFINELPISRSFAHINLLNYSTSQSQQYFPVLEVSGFDNLQPIKQQEWAGKFELSYKYSASFSAEVFVRSIRNDIFPVYQNGRLELQNIADHTKKGIELELTLSPRVSSQKKLAYSNTISFFSWQDKVTAVADGYNFTPIAGFSDVHKTIINGQALGAIVGSSYVRDPNNNIVIGQDGFPLVNQAPGVIGNPIPDFIIKSGNTLRWKRFSLLAEFEWRKGGNTWNGTQAMLDYYGRSQQTGNERTITNYIFPGVLEDGHPNNIPVDFYDPTLPVEQNRWVRYGASGIAEEYIQKSDNIRLRTLSLTYKISFRKFIQQLSITGYVNNIMLWTAYKGADPEQLLFDQPNTNGLDFFNLPSTKTYGLTASIQF